MKTLSALLAICAGNSVSIYRKYFRKTVWCPQHKTYCSSCPTGQNCVWTLWRHQMETFSALLALCAGNSPVNSPQKGQWHGALMFSLICAWINDWVNNREAGDLRRHRTRYDTTVINHFDMNRSAPNFKNTEFDMNAYFFGDIHALQLVGCTYCNHRFWIHLKPTFQPKEVSSPTSTP